MSRWAVVLAAVAAAFVVPGAAELRAWTWWMGAVAMVRPPRPAVR
jgi:hypothetical protein